MGFCEEKLFFDGWILLMGRLMGVELAACLGGKTPTAATHDVIKTENVCLDFPRRIDPNLVVRSKVWQR